MKLFTRTQRINMGFVLLQFFEFVPRTTEPTVELRRT